MSYWNTVFNDATNRAGRDFGRISGKAKLAACCRQIAKSRRRQDGKSLCLMCQLHWHA